MTKVLETISPLIIDIMDIDTVEELVGYEYYSSKINDVLAPSAIALVIAVARRSAFK
jgi:hypothetical protein